MTRKFTSIWGEGGAARPRARPAAAGADTDAESGAEDAPVRQSLRALKVMLDRGLMSRDEYEERKDALLRQAQGSPGSGR